MESANRSRSEKGRNSRLLGKLVDKERQRKKPSSNRASPKKPRSIPPKSTAGTFSGLAVRKGKEGAQALRFSPLSKEPASGPKYFFHSDIPDNYNETYMRALPRDPEWIFVYWELGEGTQNDLKRKMGTGGFESSKKILRLIDVTDFDYNGFNSKEYTDREVDRFANNWYVRVPEYGRTYVLECGFLTLDGRYFPAARSNRVGIPRFGPSRLVDPDWYLRNSDELIGLSLRNGKRNLGASEKRFGVTSVEAGEQEELFAFASGSGSGMFGIHGARIQ